MSLDDIVNRREFLRLLGIGTLGAATSMAIPDEASAQRRSSSIDIKMNNALPSGSTRKRSSTDYLILHTTEGEYAGAMRKIKRYANANYVLAKDGTIYQVVHPDHWSNHAGKSRWKGEENLSNNSVGIEIVGYHNAPLTNRQYSALRPLISHLQARYNIPDSNVLGHYQIAYDVNRFTRYRKGRGRRKDGINIDWNRIGINHTTTDPDVAAGTVIPDPLLTQILTREARRSSPRPSPRRAIQIDEAVSDQKIVYGSNTIGQGKTAWSLVGDEYDSKDTFYLLPDKQILSGDSVKDWDAMPVGTRVFQNTNAEAMKSIANPIITLASDQTVWSQIQGAYNDADTCYVLPNSNRVVHGNRMNFNRAITGTRIVLDCSGPSTLGGRNTPFRVAGREYNTERAIYVLPNGQMQTGDAIKDYNSLPRGTQMLVKKTN